MIADIPGLWNALSAELTANGQVCFESAWFDNDEMLRFELACNGHVAEDLPSDWAVYFSGTERDNLELSVAT